MNVTAAVLAGLAMGVVFGFALEKSRVFEPAVILGQMRLRNFLMLRVFLAAVVAGLIVLATLNGIAGIKLAPKATVYVADVAGGLLLGIGIALAGACPGTVLAQIGAGYRDAWFTLAGGLAGALTFSIVESRLAPLIAGGPGKLTFDALLGLPFAPVALAFAAILALTLAALDRWRPWRAEVGDACDGLPIVAPVESGGVSANASAAA